jgi:hypothetical protein
MPNKDKELEFYTDLIKQVAGESSPATVNAQGLPEANKQQQAPERLKSFAELMAPMDGVKRAEINSRMAPFLRAKVGTTDIGSLLVTSLSPRFPFVAQTETPILSVAESGPRYYTQDWNYRSSLRAQGATRASRINPEGTISTTDHQTVRTEARNTLGFYGDMVSATFVGSAQAQQQRNVNILAQEIDGELLAIRKALNYDIWNGVEQMSIAPTNIPAFGGLKEETATNVVDAGNAYDVNDSVINALTKQMGALLNSNKRRVAFVNPDQVSAARSGEIGRFANGENSYSYNMVQQMMRAAIGDSVDNIVIDRVYDQAYGGPLPFVHDYDLTAEMMVLTFDPMFLPRLVSFLLGDMEGPWQFLRPFVDLKEAVFVMDGKTVDRGDERARYWVKRLQH